MSRKTLLLGALAVMLAACGGKSSPGPSFTPVPGAPNTVLIPNTGGYGTIAAFSPTSMTVAVGTQVRWGNNDGTTHTTSSDSNLWNASLEGGQTYSYTFAAAGTFEYHCKNHSTMKGTIIVQ